MSGTLCALILVFYSICRADSALAVLAHQQLDDRQLTLTVLSTTKSTHAHKMNGYIHVQYWPSSINHNWFIRKLKWVASNFDYSAFAGSSFCNVEICKGIYLTPGAKWNVSSQVFNYHTCHFHTPCSHCANSKYTGLPEPSKRCGQVELAGLKPVITTAVASSTHMHTHAVHVIPRLRSSDRLLSVIWSYSMGRPESLQRSLTKTLNCTDWTFTTCLTWMCRGAQSYPYLDWSCWHS